MSSNRLLLAALSLVYLIGAAEAQTPGPFSIGQTLGAVQLNSTFATKQDYPAPPASIISGTTPCTGCAVNGILEASGSPTTVVNSLGTANNGVLITNATGVPSVVGGVLNFPPNDLTAYASVGLGVGALAGQMGGSAGYSNLAIGSFSMSFGSMTTAAANNVGIGSNTLQSITAGSQNVMIGFQSGMNLTIGVGNVGMGHQSFGADVSGNYNTGIGFQVGKTITSGSNNLMLGPAVASTTLSSGSQNILIGTAGNCDTPAAGTSGYFAICAMSGATHLMTGTTTAGALSLTINGSLLLPPASAPLRASGDAAKKGTVCIDNTNRLYYSATVC